MTLTSNTAPTMNDKLNRLYLEWADDNGYTHDLVDTIEEVGNDAREPIDTMALACSGTLAATALGRALGHEWALYTPQDAAVVASAIQNHLAETVANLRKLTIAVQHVGNRGEADLHALSGTLDQLARVADSIALDAAGLAPAIADLSAAETSHSLATTVHENLLKVAALVGGTAPDTCTQGPDDSCYCLATITRGSETYFLGYGELDWTLHVDSQGTRQPDGSTAWTHHKDNDLGPTRELAHPQQLAEAVEQAITRYEGRPTA